MLLFLSLAWLGTVAFVNLDTDTWQRNKPVWWLASELKSDNREVREASLDELVRRLTTTVDGAVPPDADAAAPIIDVLIDAAFDREGYFPMQGAQQLHDALVRGQIDRDTLRGLIDPILDWQADESLAWETVLGDMVLAGWTDGVTSEEQMQQFVQQSATLEFRLRPVVTLGDRVPFKMSYHIPRGPTSRWDRQPGEGLWFRYGPIQVSSGGTELYQYQRWDQSTPSEFVGGGSLSSTLRTGSALSLLNKPADYPLAATFNLSVLDGEEGQVVANVAGEVEQTVRVLPADQLSAVAIVDPSYASAMKEAVRLPGEYLPGDVRSGSVQVSTDDWSLAYLRFDLQDLPIPVAARVVVEDPATQTVWHGGRITAASGEPLRGWHIEIYKGNRIYNYEQRYEENPPFDTDGPVTITLHPSSDVAASTVDLLEYWGEPIVFENVPVHRPDPPATQPGS
jgi:hypothetical protein